MIIETDKKSLCFELSDGSKWEIPCAQSLPYPLIRKLRKANLKTETDVIDMFDGIVELYAPDLFEHVDGSTYGKIFDLWAQANQNVADSGDADLGESLALSE